MSPTARFLATQLSTENFKPHIVLPKHLLKPFLTSNSTIKYVNKISPLNSFQKSYSFPTSSTNVLNKYQNSFSNNNVKNTTKHTTTTTTTTTGNTNNYNNKSNANNNSISSIIIPSNQLTPIFNVKLENLCFSPPFNSDIIVLNPFYGQIEKYMSFVESNLITSNNFDNAPRFWSAISTHILKNGPLWDVTLESIGELKLSYIPYKNDKQNLINNNDAFYNNLLNEKIRSSNIIKHFINTPSILPQFISYKQNLILLVEQLIMEAVLNPLIYSEKLSSFDMLDEFDSSIDTNTFDFSIFSNNSKAISTKRFILNIVEESINVLKNDPLLFEIFNNSPVVNATLSKTRLFNEILNVIQNNILSGNIYSKFTNYAYSLNSNINDISKNSRESLSNEKELQESNHLRDPIKSNKFIINLGLKHGIPTPTNKYVCNLIKKSISDDETF